MTTASAPKHPLVASQPSFAPSDICNNNNDSSNRDCSTASGPNLNTLTVSNNNNIASSSASPSPSSSFTTSASTANATFTPMVQVTASLPAALTAVPAVAATAGSSTTVKPFNATSASGRGGGGVGGGGGGGGRAVRCGVGCLTKSATQPSLTNSPPALVSKPSVASLCSLQGEEPLPAGALRSVACGSVVSFTTASPGRSVEDVTAETSEYTDAKSTLSAPVELLSEFLSAVMSRDYETALKLCQSILRYEPSNTTAREFYPLILSKLRQLSAKKDSPNTSTDEGNESDDGTMDSYSSLEDEIDHEDEDEEEEKEEEKEGNDKEKAVAAAVVGDESGATSATQRDLSEVAGSRKLWGSSIPNQSKSKDQKLAIVHITKHQSPINITTDIEPDDSNPVSPSATTTTTTVRSTKSHNDYLDQVVADKNGPVTPVSETILSASGSSDLSSSGMATGSADSLFSSTESDLTLGSRNCNT